MTQVLPWVLVGLCILQALVVVAVIEILRAQQQMRIELAAATWSSALARPAPRPFEVQKNLHKVLSRKEGGR